MESLGLFSLEKRRLTGDLINVHKHLKGGCQDYEARLSGTLGNGHKLQHRNFCLILRKKFLTVRVTENWNRLPRKLVDSMEIFKSCLSTILGNVL